MRLLLIRHGETVDNVAGVYAGVRDSALTTHGVLQAQRLGAHLSNLSISQIFSSDLQRAFKTAEAIRTAQPTPPATTSKLEVLGEQDFGFYEGKTFFERQNDKKSGKEAHLEAHRNDPGFKDVESKDSMMLRMKRFVDSHLLEHIRTGKEAQTIVVVAHGIILTHLWRDILQRFRSSRVSVATGVSAGNGMGLEYLGGWSNTGYLDLSITPSKATEPIPQTLKSPTNISVSATSIDSRPDNLYVNAKASVPGPDPIKPPIALDKILLPPSELLDDFSLVVKAVNCQEHLRNLKKTRGGIGSAKHDDKQQTMESFFKKRKIG